MSAFFCNYLMMVTFISNLIMLFDFPHYLWKRVCKSYSKKTMQYYQDDWFFDMGYYMSYILTIIFLSLLFCISMPVITFFATGFFLFRYYIEKYNMLFVFVKGFESHGDFSTHIIRSLFTMLYTFQVMNTSLFWYLSTDATADWYIVFFFIIAGV